MWTSGSSKNHPRPFILTGIPIHLVYNEKLTAMAAKMEVLERVMTAMQAKPNGEVQTAALNQ
jgi:hypothetical protein